MVTKAINRRTTTYFSEFLHDKVQQTAAAEIAFIKKITIH